MVDTDKPIDPDALIYCTVQDVANELFISTIDATTTPKDTYVETLIRRKQEEIDRKTKHAFRPRQRIDELHDLEGEWEIGRGHQIGLQHKNIKTFDSAQGDKVEYWNGATYTNLLVGTTLPDGIIIHYERGIVEFKTYSWYWGTVYRYRFTYRYGEDTVPRTINELCTKMVALELIKGSMHFEHLPYGGGDRETMNDRVKNLKEDIESILADYDTVVAFY